MAREAEAPRRRRGAASGGTGSTGGERRLAARRARSARRPSPPPAAGAATRSSRPAPTRRSGPTSTTSPPTRRRRASRRPTTSSQSIVDPNAVVVGRVPAGRDAADLRQDAVARGARRARRVPEREGSQVTSTVDQHAQHETPARAADARAAAGIFMRPGYVRALWCTALFFLIGMYIVVALRWIAGWDPVYDWEYIVLVGGMVTAPLGFLLGIGTFDYWLYWISGRPTLVDDHANHGAYRWTDYFKVNTDHKVIGVQYLVTTFFFFIVGGFLAMLFRAELAQPGMQFFDTQTFNGLVSAHATLMIFVFIIPAFAGLANFAVPLMLGAPDMAFPRLNALSFWMLPVAGDALPGELPRARAAPSRPAGRATRRSPPSSRSARCSSTWASSGPGASSIATALNFLVTIITMRAPGMTFWRMPLLVWANFTTSLLVVIATPFIAGSQFFVMFDRVMHTSFFTPDNGGYVLGYQHIFWFYSHPAVYIMILPGFGIISEIISTISRKPIFGYRLMAISLLGILVLGFSVWAHHMFVAGHGRLAPDPDDDLDAADRRPDRGQGVLLAGDAVGGEDPPQHADAVRARLHLDVRDRRALGHLPRGGADRHPRLGHVLHRRPHPLRAVRRLGVHDLRGHLLLVPEDDRPDVRRAPRQAPLLDDVRRVQPHVLPDALGRARRDAAPRRRLRGDVRRAQHGRLDRVVRARRVGRDLLLQHDHELGARPDRRAPTRGGR